MPISLKENTTVPACSEWIAGGVADTRYTCRYIGIPVRIMNTSPENIELRAGTVIGYLHEIGAVELIDEQENCETDHLYRAMRVCRVHACKTSSSIALNAQNHRDAPEKWSENLDKLYERSCKKSFLSSTEIIGGTFDKACEHFRQVRRGLGTNSNSGARY